MKQRVFGIVVAFELVWAGSALGQTNAPAITPQPRAIPVRAAAQGSANNQRTQPFLRVYPSSLDFEPVAVGRSRTLSFTVRNVGPGVLTGEADVPAPFRILDGSPFVLGRMESQEVIVEYTPKVIGVNVAVVRLAGGGDASVTVTGSARRGPAKKPPKQSLRLLAGQ